ncbi:MAG TPA: TIGR04282 family arsenosugar biosynthesis glycosyltransferase [Acidobacteriota bacterium]|jgi:hypothetical protein
MSGPRLPAIAVFCRTPIAGKVKTRLQPPLSPEQALLLHVACIEDVCAHLLPLRRDFDVFIFQSEPGKLPRACAAFQGRLQQGTDLGERMLTAVTCLLEEQHPSVLLFGTDLPHLDAKNLYQALEWLSRVEVVIGPSRDGGYYLLGLSSSLPFLFRRMVWGSDAVLAETLHRLKKHELTHYLMETCFDLDRADDLKRLLSSPDAARAPRTVAFIEQIKSLL